MAKSKKIGTFGGVFTPSILTILGVIMYLRLPWIAGQAGLYMTIGIILLAHLISVTTGLSVSSIATDKKVQAGGTYYMISRSLGLPIGGTLGLALFVGLSFSVSLYLIGFAESFLSYWNLPMDKNTIRMTGTIVLIAVTIITFISTSLAIKTQYFIMAAIGLSLLSIILGNHQYAPSEPTLLPSETAAPFIVLFGIFFPAVTGFEAGVSMSGDLKDPKKSIPLGTISAIVIGLVVYILLAFFFSTQVSPELLENDPKALFKIALIPELVIAGIWGATLSSALGSILGAPRILQATSTDKITPEFFGVGFGESNEPRNALMLTFIIAEAGILIGELDVIARIVSMFFITTYGFLNLSCAIEGWASSDFYPSFKVPGIVSLIGSVACFIVMIQLDFVAMIGATIILGALFIYLKRKELTLESGDTWEGVWASLVRTGLTKLKGRVKSVRNWRPNIILFSGGLQNRPHLVEMSKAIAGKLGVISNFDFIEDPDSETLFDSAIKEAEQQIDAIAEGIFSKKLKCKNIYQGIETITRIYGFTGIEPNTVLMGWARNTKYPDQFARLIDDLNKMDYNIVFLDYDNERGFGSRKTIDLWWRGYGNNFSFALTILRFIRSSSLWKEATLRILFIVDEDVNVERVFKNANQVLEQYRIEAEIKILREQSKSKTPLDIIISESASTDLIILGISDESLKNPDSYIKKMNEFMDKIGTVMLIHSSSFFEKIDIGILRKTGETAHEKIETEITPLPEVIGSALAGNLRKLDEDMISIIKTFSDETILFYSAKHSELLSKLGNLAGRQFNILEKALGESGMPRLRKLAHKTLNDLLFHIYRITEEYSTEYEKKYQTTFDSALESFENQTKDLIEHYPDYFNLHFEKDAFKSDKNDNVRLRFFKLRKRISASLSKKVLSVKLNFRKLLQYYILHKQKVRLADVLNEAGVSVHTFFSDLKIFILSLHDSLEKICIECENGNYSSELIKSEREKIQDKLTKIQSFLSENAAGLRKRYVISWRNDLMEINEMAATPTVNYLIKKKLRTRKSEKVKIDYADKFSFVFRENYNLFISDLKLETVDLRLKGRIKSVKEDVVQSFSEYLLNKILKPIEEIKNEIDEVNGGKIPAISLPEFSDPSSDLLKEVEENLSITEEFFETFPEKTDVPSDDFITEISRGEFNPADVKSINFRRLAEILIETAFAEPIIKDVEKIGELLSELNENLRDAINLANFNISSLEDETPDRQKLIEDYLTSLKQKLDKFSNEAVGILENFIASIEKHYKLISEMLNPFSLKRTSEEMGLLVRKQESRKLLQSVSDSFEQAQEAAKRVLVDLIYGKSKGIIFARKQKSYSKTPGSTIGEVLQFVKSVSPKPDVYSTLPNYYKKLFSCSSRISKDFWVEMRSEMQTASAALNYYKSGYHGALLILGERNSGKTTLSGMIANKYFRADRIFSLRSPANSTSNVSDFEKFLRRHINLSGSIDSVFNTLPSDCAMIINDLEIWWERNESGFEVVDLISDLVRKYSDKILFIINCNIHSFQLINKIKRIDDLFISSILCEPFNSENLKELILRRHNSSGLMFQLGNKDEEQIGELKLAGLFDRYFDYYDGNPGTAMNGWLANIKKYDSNKLIIQNPAIYDLSPLEELNEDWLIYLAQISLHRRISLESLLKVMKANEKSGADIVRTLLRSGLIIEKSSNVYGINLYIEPFLIKVLKKRMLII
ncbi:amino acid permease [Ignavibacterium sp.]|uniref:amino acid permease n=1 Tax=Ignavibacterium sp. TaxID=2651167 RepID=UPI00220F0DF6|nr:amino acid permease [Ignavibacterium sp.]BDQ02744.1 MAG: hypothetical protein KatS3mg037_1319 [Ignavibacterium sp.]